MKVSLLPPDESAPLADLAPAEAARSDLGPESLAAHLALVLVAEPRMAWAKSFCADSAICRSPFSFSSSTLTKVLWLGSFLVLGGSLVQAFRSALVMLPLPHSAFFSFSVLRLAMATSCFCAAKFSALGPESAIRRRN